MRSLETSKKKHDELSFQSARIWLQVWTATTSGQSELFASAFIPFMEVLNQGLHDLEADQLPDHKEGLGQIHHHSLNQCEVSMVPVWSDLHENEQQSHADSESCRQPVLTIQTLYMVRDASGLEKDNMPIKPGDIMLYGLLIVLTISI